MVSLLCPALGGCIQKSAWEAGDMTQHYTGCLFWGSYEAHTKVKGEKNGFDMGVFDFHMCAIVCASYTDTCAQ